MHVRLPITGLLATALLSGCMATVGAMPRAGSRPPVIVNPTSGGGSLISDKGLGLIATNGGGLIGKVKIPTGLVAAHSASLVSNNGGGIVSNNAGGLISDKGLGYRVLALDEKPLVGFTVTIVDASGAPVKDAQGKPYQTTTDADGNYTFKATPRGENLLVRVSLPSDVGPMLAYLPDADAGASRQADVDAASTLVMGYILDKYVKNQQTVLQKLPAQAAADTQAKAQAAIGDTLALQSFTAPQIDQTVDALRTKDQAFDAQVKYVESLLVAGLKDVGDGQPATSVALSSPTHLLFLPDGSMLVVERNGYRVRRVDPAGVMTTFAGKDGATGLGDGGPASQAWVDRPNDAIADAQGNVYLSDFGNDRIRRVDAKTGLITTVAGGGTPSASDTAIPDGTPATQASITHPDALALDAKGQLVFSCSEGTFRLQADGTLQQTSLPPGLNCLVLGPDGDLYAYKQETNEILKMDGANTVADTPVKAAPVSVTGYFTVAPDGSFYMTADTQLLHYVNGAWQPQPNVPPLTSGGGLLIRDNTLYFTDVGAGRVYKAPLDGSAAPTLVAGMDSATTTTGVAADKLSLNRPLALMIDKAGNLLVADSFNATIWERRPDGLYYRFAGNGPAAATTTDIGDGGPALNAKFGYIGYITPQPDGGTLVIDAPIPVFRLRSIAADGTVNPYKLPSGAPATPAFAVFGPDGTLYVSDYLTKSVVSIKGDTVTTVVPAGALQQPSAIVPLQDGSFDVSDSAGNAIYHVVGTALTKIAGGGQSGFAGDGGPAKDALLNSPTYMTLDPQGNLVFSDSRNDRIRRIDAKTGVITTIAGAGSAAFAGTTIDDSLKDPAGLAFDAQGNLFIADSDHNQIKELKAAQLGGQ